jgi:hypothetical protein
VSTYSSYLTFFSLAVVIISTQNMVVNKDYVEVYRASVDELLQFHQLKWNLNHLDKFHLKARKFFGFSMHECNAHFFFFFILASNSKMLQWGGVRAMPAVGGGSRRPAA